MARECMREAEATHDADRKRTLKDMATLYVQTAYSLEQEGQANPPGFTIGRAV